MSEKHQVNGRQIMSFRVDNAIMVGRPKGTMRQAVFHEASGDAPPGHKVASEIWATPAGILFSMDGERDKLVPWGNVIETDFADDGEGARREKKEPKAAASDGRIIGPSGPVSANVRPVVENVRPQAAKPRGAA